MRIIRILMLVCCLTSLASAENLTLPTDQRPAWLQRDGIVMAGNWEPMSYRLRGEGGKYRPPTPEESAAYALEQSPEMITRLKALGVNFVMMHCYKGCGLENERESMADAVRFAKLCHDAGVRVGVYNFSGAFLYESFFSEVPQARDWILLDEKGAPYTYGHRNPYRYYWDRNHPDAQAFYHNLVKFAVEDIKTDLVHFDNYERGPGSDRNSVERFRKYLAAQLTAKQRQAMGIADADIATAIPPIKKPDSPLFRAWQEFTSRSLADSYADMNRYARSLRKDILVECNPGGIYEAILPPRDHGRLLQGGEAFWDEGGNSGYRDGKLHSRIRSLKIARKMNNMAFFYTMNPLEAAEAMAFNLDCLGCICWYQFGKIVNRPGAKEPVVTTLAPFIEFFHKRRDLLRNASVVADVAVLRNFASQTMGNRKYDKLTHDAEQTMIERRVPFQIIYDHHLADLSGYRVLVLAGCPGLSDEQVGQIKRFVDKGGSLCIVGPLATHDEWMIQRDKPALDDLPAERVARIEPGADILAAINKLCPAGLAVSIDAPANVCVELTRQTNRTLVHLVNYQSEVPAENVRVHLRGNWKKPPRVTLASPDAATETTVESIQKPGGIEFTVPETKIYTIAVVDD